MTSPAVKDDLISDSMPQALAAANHLYPARAPRNEVAAVTYRRVRHSMKALAKLAPVSGAFVEAGARLAVRTFGGERCIYTA
jgi:hypothetical protein